MNRDDLLTVLVVGAMLAVMAVCYVLQTGGFPAWSTHYAPAPPSPLPLPNPEREVSAR